MNDGTHAAVHGKRRGTIRLAGWLACVVVFAVLTRFDPRLVGPLRVSDTEALQHRDWWQFLRAVGYLPTWLAIGGAMMLARAGRPASAGTRADLLRQPGLMVIFSAGAAGVLAELIKRAVGRLRPSGDGAYQFKAFLEGFTDDRDLGMPSSHAAVAFGAAFALHRLLPAPGWLAIVLAVGCGLSRLWAGAHYTTDVFVAAVIGYACAAMATGLAGPRAAADAIDP